MGAAESYVPTGQPGAKHLDKASVARAMLLACGLVTVAGCGSTPPGGGLLPADFPQAYYRTGAPFGDVSEALEEVLPSVLRVSVRADYDVYFFEEREAPSVDELRAAESDVLARAVDRGTASLTQAASAVVVGVVMERATLVTTGHGITLPDTTVAYFDTDDRGPLSARPVQRVSIKRSQSNTVVGPRLVESFELLGTNPESDLAAIGVELSPGADSGGLRALRVASGSPSRLSWGSLVYVVGHPAGHQMVTQATVSRPDLGSREAFLTDALLNEGSSGGPILAMRGDTGELEWVGIARAAASRTEYRLEPRDEPERAPEPARLYDGPIYLRQAEELRYGITFSIPVGEIRSFLEDLEPWLTAVGYPIPRL